jgi:hypothetical protein
MSASITSELESYYNFKQTLDPMGPNPNFSPDNVKTWPRYFWSLMCEKCYLKKCVILYSNFVCESSLS